jgi:hypothetical protein
MLSSSGNLEAREGDEMGLTRYPNGLTTNSTTALQYNANAGDGDVDCLDMFVSGTATISLVSATNVVSSGQVRAANGSVFGVRIPLAVAGTAGAGSQTTISLTSALYATAATAGLRAPATGVFELIWITGATANITGSIRVTATSVSTGTDLVTLSVGSGTTAANTVYSTIGAVSISVGSEFCVTSAVQATANTSSLLVNFIMTSA